MLAAPVSGNPKVAESGRLTIVASGPQEAWELARPYLELLCRRVTYVGEGERARLVKICHNLMLGIVAQCMAEVTVLAEKGGIKRSDFLEFLNDSVMGSTFTRYKTPAYVNLDFTPTFTPELLLKDFHLGFEAAREMEVSMPLAATTEQIIQGLVGLDRQRRRFRRAARAGGERLRARARARERRRRRWPQPERRHREAFTPRLSSASWRRSATPPQALLANVCDTIARDRLNRVEKETGWPASRPPNSKRRPAST